ncbi:MAG: peptidase, partial [Hyphomicrobiales bacterium]|nr:peptidase [Hyphomicrobiales bacterium]
NWGGQGLHPRGNFEGFMRAASQDKYLEAHGLEHWTHFYTDYGRDLQKRFFDFYLKGEQNGWKDSKRVTLQVRHVDHFEQRAETEWPLARTQWMKFHLDGDRLATNPARTKREVSFKGMGDGVTFLSTPFARETEITGPVAAKLRVSSSTSDADLFLVLRVFSPDMKEVTFVGAIDPHTPIAQGWLRASHRKLDKTLSQPWRPYHAHDEIQPLTPGVPVDLDIELWPTSIVVPAGYRIALTVRGKDYEWQKTTGARLSNFKNELLGCGPFLHNDPRDRPASMFDGLTTIHLGEEDANYILLPIIG